MLARQNPDGGFPFNDLFSDSDPQSTAYAVILLRLYRTHAPSRAARMAASQYLASLQAANGGFPYYGGPDEVTEANSEILLAIALAPRPDPCPSRRPHLGRRRAGIAG